MLISIIISMLLIAILLLSLAYPIQAGVVWLRNYAFIHMNNRAGMLIPNRKINDDDFRALYKNKDAQLRSQGAQLPNLFWYFLSPGAYMHQETMEAGAHYDAAAPLTRKILAKPAADIEKLIAKSTQQFIDSNAVPSYQLVKLRDVMIPIWTRFFYELVFAKPCSEEESKKIIKNAENFITTVKCCSLRDMPARYQVVEMVKQKLQNGEFPFEVPAAMSLEDQAYYLRGIFLTTAITQLSEAVSHILLCLAQHPNIQTDVANAQGGELLGRVIDETLRLFPLFGVALRITSADIDVRAGLRIAKGTSVCFHHPTFHQMGYSNPQKFCPARWLVHNKKETNFIPFGFAENHGCPAQGLARIAIAECVKLMVNAFTIESSIVHSRSLVERGPALLIRKTHTCPHKKWLLLYLRFKNRCDLIYLSSKQLILGSYIFFNARKLKLAEKHFAAVETKEKSSP